MIELIRELLMLPPGGSTFADEIDVLHAVVIGVAMLGAVVVALVAILLLRRYRAHGRDLEIPVPRWTMPGAVEVVMIAGVSALFLGWWLVGVRQYDRMRVPPDGSIPIYVVAKQWMFEFTHPNGLVTADVVTVPAGQPVSLVMTSRDVIHSLYVPAFRVKYDVLPDRFTTMWFQATEPGDYPILCAEFCGTGHSTMRGMVRVLDPVEYQAWLHGGSAPSVARRLEAPRGEELQPDAHASIASLAERGREIAASQGCLRCHSIDGSPHIAPSFAGLYDREVRLTDGRTIVADEAYLTRSLMDPLADVVAGFQEVMPSYRGQLQPAEVAALLELIGSLRDTERWSSEATRPASQLTQPLPQAQGRPVYPNPTPNPTSGPETPR